MVVISRSEMLTVSLRIRLLLVCYFGLYYFSNSYGSPPAHALVPRKLRPCNAAGAGHGPALHDPCYAAGRAGFSGFTPGGDTAGGWLPKARGDNTEDSGPPNTSETPATSGDPQEGESTVTSETVGAQKTPREGQVRA